MLPTSKIKNTPEQWQELYLNMEEKLNDIEKGMLDLATKIRISITACRLSVDSLKMHINNHIFQSTEEEIYFLKRLNQRFIAILFTI